VRCGGLIIIDNVLWYGKVADEAVVDKQTEALRQLAADLLVDTRIDLSIVPIGDGIAMCRKRSADGDPGVQ
jgi:O-methyltransferase